MRCTRFLRVRRGEYRCLYSVHSGRCVRRECGIKKHRHAWAVRCLEKAFYQAFVPDFMYNGIGAVINDSVFGGLFVIAVF